MNFNNIVGIIAANRLPIGKVNGFYKDISPEILYKNLINQQFSITPSLDKKKIDHIILGNVTNLGGNLARRCSLAAGFPRNIPAFTIDNQCGSGLTAVLTAANMIISGNASIICTGGVESTSQANIVINPKTNQPIKRFKMAPSPYDDFDMGVLADQLAKNEDISRTSQDLYAFNSHQKACNAISNNYLIPDEILPFKTNEICIFKDQTVRSTTSLQKLARLSPAFTANGTATAGNSCPINDGVSSIILSSLSVPFNFKGYYIGQVTLALDPSEFLYGPIASTEKLLEKFNLKVKDIEAFEVNEAFAAQALLFQKHFKLSDAKLNTYGGAIAYGHPYGATGGILIARLLNRLNKIEKSSVGIVTLCVAGGMGISILIGNKRLKS